jgi:hypothetical protein
MSIITFQVAVTTTGTSQRLPSNDVKRAITISAKSTNTAAIVLGNIAAVTSSTGYILEKGQCVTVELAGGNTAAFYIIGTAGDVLSVIGV